MSDTLGLCFSLLPTLILFNQLTPNKIEASMFALLTGIFNFSMSVGGPLFGSVLAQFFNVTSKDMSNYYVLIIIQILCEIGALFLIPLIPLKCEL